MKVLFVCSGARNGECSAAVSGQARALEKQGLSVSFFRVSSGGLPGYIGSIPRLRQTLKRQSYDVVHAHYGLSGIMAALSGAGPLIVSLMGSDVLGSFWLRWLMRFFAAFVWPVTIVKSQSMADVLKAGRPVIIPNGVDLSLFVEMPREEARENAGFTSSKVVLWPADPRRRVKDVELARSVMEVLARSGCHLEIVTGKPLEEMPVFYNAADVVLLTSRYEGSPNVVKEALACNVPVVSTPVGDVKKWLSNLSGCRVCPANPAELAKGVALAIDAGGWCNGRQRVKEVDDDKIVEKILGLYRERIKSFRKRNPVWKSRRQKDTVRKLFKGSHRKYTANAGSRK
ncbi:MAG: glycosyltransferase [Marinilabilia sp.]